MLNLPYRHYRRAGRPWVIVHFVPGDRPVNIARFSYRYQAEEYLKSLRYLMPTSDYEIVFDMSADPVYWEQKYQENDTPWDLGQASPPLRNLLDSDQPIIPNKAAVLGCGRGYDAILFAEYGFEVYGFDFSPSAIIDAR